MSELQLIHNINIQMLHDQIKRLKSNLQATDIDPSLKIVWEEEIEKSHDVDVTYNKPFMNNPYIDYIPYNGYK